MATTTDITRPLTRHQLTEILTAQGLGQEAIDLVCRVTALDRARARVEETLLRARDAGQHLGVEPGVILLLDLVGIGGTAGCTGDGTDRMSYFRRCGKGRKQAGDGAAWMAAAEYALGAIVAERGDTFPALVRGGILILAEEMADRAWVVAACVRTLACVHYPEHRDDMRGYLSLIGAETACAALSIQPVTRE